MNTNSEIFALDIGTRTIVGLIGKVEDNGKLVVRDVEIAEHEGRSMLDGQIHDIGKVADTVIKIKEKLEKNTTVH